MHDTDPGPRAGLAGPVEDGAPETVEPSRDEGSTGFDALRDDVDALMDNVRTYAEAEIAFQKTRASLAGKRGGRALVLLVLALVLLHIALIALAVGAVIALAPLVTIWGAIAIVVGVLVGGVVALVMGAAADGRTVAAMFGSGEER